VFFFCVSLDHVGFVFSNLVTLGLVFTARCYASAVLAMGLCSSVSVSVTSGRASELAGIIELVDRRRPSLSRSGRPPFSI